MAEPPPTYTRAEMDEILKRAIERQQAKAEEIGHEDLVSAAAEVGIPREEVEAAARDLEAQKAKQAAADARASRERPAPAPRAPDDVDEHRARAVRRLQRSAMTFFGLGMFFFFLGRSGEASWWMWPVFGMGVSLVIQASRVFFGDPGGEARRDEERRLSRRERRRMRREERFADFERKVSIGADALVRVIDEARGAKARIEENLRPKAPPARGPRVIVTPPPQPHPGTGPRVDAREAETVERDERDAPADARRNRGA